MNVLLPAPVTPRKRIYSLMMLTSVAYLVPASANMILFLRINDISSNRYLDSDRNTVQLLKSLITPL